MIAELQRRACVRQKLPKALLPLVDRLRADSLAVEMEKVKQEEDKRLAIPRVRCVLDRIKQTNPKLRAYITVLEDSALSQASQADKEIKAGRWRGPLHGRSGSGH